MKEEDFLWHIFYVFDYIKEIFLHTIDQNIDHT